MNVETPAPQLKEYGFFGKLPQKRRLYLESKLKKIVFPVGSEIIKKGQSGSFLGILESGMVEERNTQGNTRTLKAGDYFGSEMLRFDKPSSFTITALSDSIISVLHREDWLAPSPSSPPRSLSPGKPLLNKAGWIGLVSTLAVVMTLITLGPTLLDAANNFLPKYFIEKGRPDRAEDYLRFSIKLQPEYAKVYGVLGDILVLQDKDEEAIEIYQQAIEIDEYLPWIHNNLGVLLMERAEYSQAEDHLLKAQYLNPVNTDIYQNLGNAFYRQKLWQSASTAYQNALELDFSLIQAKAAWAGLILYESRLVEAKLIWEDVLLEDPRHFQALQGLGVVSLLEDDPNLALMYLDAAYFLDPDDPTMHLYTGMALEALDKPDEAAVEYQSAVELGSDPELISLANALLQVVLE
ncbi:MAG: tetratricopeptide repeat protein [Anaerolineales bacterium]|nr:tetratricopeptide repeat protein [Anaerolineales bacterium]